MRWAASSSNSAKAPAAQAVVREADVPPSAPAAPLRVESLERRLLSALTKRLNESRYKDLATKPDALSRARDLPAMFLRHGPHQVLVFLYAKEGSDPVLAELLVKLFQDVNPASGLVNSLSDLYGTGRPSLDKLATHFVIAEPDDLTSRIADQRTFAEISRWLARILEATAEPK
jgi:hypothetical protein